MNWFQPIEIEGAPFRPIRPRAPGRGALLLAGGLLACLLFLAAPPAAESSGNASPETVSRTGGTIRGKVVLQGNPPAPRLIELNEDCKKLHPGKATSQNVIVDAHGGIKNAVVYLSKGVPKSFPPPTGSVTLKQKGCSYLPHVVTMSTRQKLIIINQDDTLHNVHSLPFKNRPINQAQPQKDQKLETTMRVPEFVRFKCDVHNWMNAYVAVFKHPFESVSSADGSFEIRNVPPGKYTIKAWHEFYGNGIISKPLAQKIEVKPGSTVELTFTFHPPGG